jgi:hypothetical protein
VTGRFGPDPARTTPAALGVAASAVRAGECAAPAGTRVPTTDRAPGTARREAATPCGGRVKDPVRRDLALPGVPAPRVEGVWPCRR